MNISISMCLGFVFEWWTPRVHDACSLRHMVAKDVFDAVRDVYESNTKLNARKFYTLFSINAYIYVQEWI